MAGHPLFPIGREKVSAVCVAGSTFKVHVSYHCSAGIDGYIVGIKFTDNEGSMDSAKQGRYSGPQVGIAIGQQAMHMVRPDLEKIAIMGFYLLTDDLEKRGRNAVRAKRRMYNSRALMLHKEVRHVLPVFTTLETSGGVAWAMAKQDFTTHWQFDLLVEQLGKQLEVSRAD